ncbi:MAG: insulinase family protein [Opitutae bacterium]|nr:insulinase family protein [Opitutae bacterium]
MTFLRQCRAIARGFFLFLALADRAAAAAWPVTGEGLAPDPAWQWGTLDNGLRYVIRRHAVPPGHISFRLGVEVGSAHEGKAERGFAHFVEHMAFNGTTHFKGETLVPALERHGVGIGPELSAFTFQTHTLYYLDGPSVAPADLDRWFLVLRDFADGLQFDARQIKRERGVIASELRDRESPGSRAELARRRFLYPLSALSNPIGGGEAAADQRSLRKFYEKWYRPDRMILAVVGDADPAVLERLVKQNFSTLPRPTAPSPVFDQEFISNPAGTNAAVHHDPRSGALSAEVISVLPYHRADGLALRRRWLAQSLLLYMLNVRLHELVRTNPDRFYDLSARSLVPTPYNVETSIGFSAPPKDWSFAMTTVERELRRSFVYTFTADELREARAALLSGYEQQARASATVRSADLAGNVVQQALWGYVATAPSADLDHHREWLASIDAIEVNRAWRSLWQERRAQIFASGFFPVPKGPAALTAAFEASARQEVDAPAGKPDHAFAYADFGPPGKIKHRDYLPALDLHTVEFENGVRANLKATPFEAATVHLRARFGRGLAAEPPDQPGLGALVDGSFLNGALGRHSPADLRRLLSASALALSFHCAENSFEFAGQSAPASLDLLLRTVSAYLTDPAWDKDSVALAATQLTTYSHDLVCTPEGIISARAFRHLAGGDQRYAPPAVPEIQARTADEMRRWLDHPLRAAPLELGLVGDFDPEQAIQLLARTLGALPARSAAHDPVRPVTLAKQAPPQHYRYQGEANRDGIEVVWPLDRCDDVRTSRAYELLAAILGERLRQRIREDLGATYAPAVSFWKSEASPRDGYLTAYLTVKAGAAARLGKSVVELADQLGRHGVDAAELARGREPILARSVTDEKENAYWVEHIIAKVQSQPEVRQWPLTRVSDFQTMTADEINALARKILPAARAIVFSATPDRP